MGKRNKNRDLGPQITDEIEDLKSGNKEKLNKSDKLHKRKKNKNKLIPVQEHDNDVDKCKKIKIDDHQATTECTNATICKSVKKNKSEKKLKKTETAKEMMSDYSPESLNKAAQQSSESKLPKIEKPKKIKFGEDGEVQVNTSCDIQDTNDKKSYLNAEEREIQDEDIDQFCNEIDDEDNKQYESWISLLEQKLGSNESTSSNKKKRNKRKNKNKSN